MPTTKCDGKSQVVHRVPEQILPVEKEVIAQVHHIARMLCLLRHEILRLSYWFKMWLIWMVSVIALE